MRRLVAIVVISSLATSSVAFAAPMDCPTLRARAVSHCCCPTGTQEHARLSCCRDVSESRVVGSIPREQTERSQLAPPLVVVAHLQLTGGFQAAVAAIARGFPSSTAGLPLVPLRI